MVETGTPPLLSLEIRPLGGKLAEASASNGAVGSIDAGFVLFAVGFAPTPEIGQAVEDAVDRVQAAFQPWAARRTYFNFAERAVEPDRLYPPETYRRLRRIRAQYDSGELFLANHSIPPAR
jgi:hypothetical protein